MFDIGFTELVIIGVVALIVVGPERLPKLARTAGHLYGRMQRYVSSVKSDISQEIQLDEMRRVGERFKESVESSISEMEQRKTVVDDYLRHEASGVTKAVSGAPAEDKPAVASPAVERIDAGSTPQQSLPLDEPDQYATAAKPHSIVETAGGEPVGKTP